MANPLFKEMNQNTNGLEQQFVRFMKQMEGKNPNQMINQMLQGGQINQQQLNIAQQRAQQLSGMLKKFMR